MNESLVAYPYVIVRIGCEACKRQGSYRVARLAEKYGAGIALPELLKRLTSDCGLQHARHPYQGTCRARYVDLEPPQRPPDTPARALKLVAGGRRRD